MKRSQNKPANCVILGTSSPRPKVWRKAYVRVFVEPDGEKLIAAALLGPYAFLCALTDGVAILNNVKNEPILVPVSWALANYPQHSEALKKLAERADAAMQKGEEE